MLLPLPGCPGAAGTLPAPVLVWRLGVWPRLLPHPLVWERLQAEPFRFSGVLSSGLLDARAGPPKLALSVPDSLGILRGVGACTRGLSAPEMGRRIGLCVWESVQHFVRLSGASQRGAWPTCAPVTPPGSRAELEAAQGKVMPPAPPPPHSAPGPDLWEGRGTSPVS